LGAVDWKAAGAAYLPHINAVEHELGLPADLLARLAFQECSWRPDVIYGRITSPSGAVGMFQLMPEYFPGAGISWQLDAETAGKYLILLHRRFQDWTLALAAYNWGPNNAQKYVEGQLSKLPAETAHYVAQITADTGLKGALA